MKPFDDVGAGTKEIRTAMPPVFIA